MWKRLSSCFINWVDTAPTNSSSIRSSLKDVIDAGKKYKKGVDDIYQFMDDSFEEQIAQSKQIAKQKYDQLEKEQIRMNNEMKQSMKDRLKDTIPNLDSIMKGQTFEDKELTKFADLDSFLKSVNQIQNHTHKEKVHKDVKKLQVSKNRK